jgi:hypothetical protein
MSEMKRRKIFLFHFGKTKQKISKIKNGTDKRRFIKKLQYKIERRCEEHARKLRG